MLTSPPLLLIGSDTNGNSADAFDVLNFHKSIAKTKERLSRGDLGQDQIPDYLLLGEVLVIPYRAENPPLKNELMPRAAASSSTYG